MANPVPVFYTQEHTNTALSHHPASDAHSSHVPHFLLVQNLCISQSIAVIKCNNLGSRV